MSHKLVLKSRKNTASRFIKSDKSKQSKSPTTQEIIGYYIPFYHRPTIDVTINMLERVNPEGTINPVLRESRNKVYDKLSKSLGDSILKYSPHIYTGLIIRGGIYIPFLWYFIPSAEHFIVVTAIFLVFYSVTSLILLDDVNLHKRYLNLMK